MACMVMESMAIANDLIAVRYQGASAAALTARCEDWMNRRENEEWTIRSRSSMVPQQLDLLDKATDRVKAVLFNLGRAA